MNRAVRNKLSILETTLSKHVAMETRLLADLRRAGFKFKSIGQAYETLRAQRTLHMFTEEQIAVAIRVFDNKQKRKM